MPPLDHIAFQTGDLDAAIAFYCDRLGFTLDFRAVNAEQREAYAFLALGDLRLELIQDLNRAEYTPPEVKPPYCPHLALTTGDMDATLAALRAAGVTILRGPLAIPGEETWLYFTDPDHNVLEYIQWLSGPHAP